MRAGRLVMRSPEGGATVRGEAPAGARHAGFTFWNGPFGQWAPSVIALHGRTFRSAEQATMVGKAMPFGDRAAAEEQDSQKPLGRRARGFSEAMWNERRRGIVERISRTEFAQNKRLRRKRFQTGRTPMVEASPLDLVRCVGLDAAAARAADPRDRPGLNLLGLILTDVRDELARKHRDEAAACAP